MLSTIFIIFITVSVLITLYSLRPYYVVTMTTIPSRIYKIEEIINSLQKQLLPPSYIILNIPEKYNRFDDTIEEMPSFITTNPKIIVNRVKTDYGPATKMLGILENDNLPIDKDTIILVADDDVVHRPLWSYKLLQNIVLNPHAVSSIFNANHHPKPIVFGNGGWGFYMGILDTDDVMQDYELFKGDCIFVDDDFFTNYFNNKKIPILRAGTPVLYGEDIKVLKVDNALHAIEGENSRKKATERCNTSMKS